MGSADAIQTDRPDLPANLTYRLLPELSETGDAAHLQGRLAVFSISKGALTWQLPDGVGYQLELSNTGNGVLLAGSASATAYTECTRCLDQAKLELEAEVQVYYLLDPDDAEAAHDIDEAQVVGRDSKIDLAEPVIAGLIHELPFTVLCREDCKGICDKCYANLNNEPCSCVDGPDPDHPLAKLRTLFPED